MKNLQDLKGQIQFVEDYDYKAMRTDKTTGSRKGQWLNDRFSSMDKLDVSSGTQKWTREELYRKKPQ